MRLLLVGATGLVGRHILEQALADSRITKVVAPVRRPLAASHPKLMAPQVDFNQLPAAAPWWNTDAVLCALGTTMKAAGSQEAFRQVDYQYPMAVARLARQHGTSTFVLNSALNASVSSRFFYSRVKGKLERDLEALGFPSLTHVRPGLIGGKREEFRLGESLAAVVLGTLGPLLPRRWRINPASTIARAMLDAAIAARPGVHGVDSAQLATPPD